MKGCEQEIKVLIKQTLLLAAAAGIGSRMTSWTLAAQHLAGEEGNDWWADGHGDRKWR